MLRMRRVGGYWYVIDRNRDVDEYFEMYGIIFYFFIISRKCLVRDGGIVEVAKF